QYNHQINAYHAPLGALSQDSGNQSSLFARKYVGETTSDSLDAYATGPFELFGRELELVLGQSVAISTWKNKAYNALFASGTN
ncbi:hypothetical protein Q6272_31840, partial [Klebsiella pneumoniae]|uniref:hypothetical protein n=1 Tax=Klebsiella pneumoniae TaxID=573 RepID=UPI0027301074